MKLRIEDFPPHFQAQIRAQMAGEDAPAMPAGRSQPAATVPDGAPRLPDALRAPTPPPARSVAQKRAERREEVKRLHEPFRQWLNLRGLPFVYARPDRESTIRAGWPDFSVILPGARIVACEMKWPGQALRPEQAAVRALLESSEVPYLVAYSAADAIAFVRSYLDPKGEACQS